jgi:hypothetical protein
MPLAIGTGTVTPTPEEPPVVTPTPVERLEVTWIAPDGTEVPLTQDALGWHVMPDWAGLGAAPIEQTVDADPLGGVQLRHTQAVQRYITLPIRFSARLHMDLITNWRYVGEKLLQTRRLGPGTLRVRQPDGSSRQIPCHYTSGFDSEQRGGWLWDLAVVTLLATDPYWSDVTAQTFYAEYVSTAVDYQDPYPSVSSAINLASTLTVHNPGEAEAYPSWVITGPMTAIVATNVTTGEAFTLTHTLTAGQQATITTRPPTVRGNSGENITDKLTWPGAVLWALEPGDNDVTFAVTGSASGSRVDLSWTPRYEMA